MNTALLTACGKGTTGQNLLAVQADGPTLTHFILSRPLQDPLRILAETQLSQLHPHSLRPHSAEARLFQAFDDKDTRRIRILIETEKPDLTVRDRQGLGVAFRAVLLRDSALLYYLLHRDTPPDIPNLVGQTALSYCLQAGERALASQLLKAGADQNVPDAGGYSPRDYAQRHGMLPLLSAPD